MREAPALCGFRNGNHTQSGCLTSQSSARIHSCERGMGCRVMDEDTDAKVVHIVPIVTRLNGAEVAEIGAGGGKGDLDQKEELETGHVADVGKLMELCAKQIKDEALLSRVLALLQTALDEGKGNIHLNAALQKESQNSEDDLSLHTLVSVLSTHATNTENVEERKNETLGFPYSRHSSYSELCNLVEAFRPKDVYPCTVDEAHWLPTLSMNTLFGSFCSADIFRHDAEMMELYESRVDREKKGKRGRTPNQEESLRSERNGEVSSPEVLKRSGPKKTTSTSTTDDEVEETEFYTPAETLPKARCTPELDGRINVPMTCPIAPRLRTHSSSNSTPNVESKHTLQNPNPVPNSHPPLSHARSISTPDRPSSTRPTQPSASSPSPPAPSSPSSVSGSSFIAPTLAPTKPSKSRSRPKSKLTNRAIAYQAALGIGLTWADLGGLVSTRKASEMEEEEL